MAASPKRPARRLLAVLAAASLLALVPAARAQTWSEIGDAGDLVGTAQLTLGSGGLATIFGALASPADADVYCVSLFASPPAGTPLVWLDCSATQGPNIWLFDALGQGVVTNETCAGGMKLLSAPASPLPPGNYYVAVAYYGYQPQSAGGDLWLLGPPGQRPPDGPGAGGSLVGWGGTGNVQPINPYSVGCNGSYVHYCDAAVPAGRPTWGTLKIRYGP